MKIGKYVRNDSSCSIFLDGYSLSSQLSSQLCCFTTHFCLMQFISYIRLDQFSSAQFQNKTVLCKKKKIELARVNNRSICGKSSSFFPSELTRAILLLVRVRERSLLHFTIFLSNLGTKGRRWAYSAKHLISGRIIKFHCPCFWLRSSLIYERKQLYPTFPVTRNSRIKNRGLRNWNKPSESDIIWLTTAWFGA